MSRRRFPSITDPTPTIDGLFSTILDLKQHAEVVSGTRGQLGPALVSKVSSEYFEPGLDWVPIGLNLSVPVQAGDIVRVDAVVTVGLYEYAGLRLTRNRVVIYEPHPANNNGPYGIEGYDGGSGAAGGYYQTVPMYYLDLAPGSSIALYSIEARIYDNSFGYLEINPVDDVTNGKSIIIAQRFTPSGL